MPRILIAEDEPRIVAFIEKGLQRSGYETIAVCDGNAVMPLLDSQSFALLLLDLGLPNKDGWEILADLQRRQTALPVVIVTAREIDRPPAHLPIGTSALVRKPFTFSTLLAQIQRLL